MTAGTEAGPMRVEVLTVPLEHRGLHLWGSGAGNVFLSF